MKALDDRGELLPTSVKFSRETKGILEALCQATGMTQSDVLAAAIRHWIPEGARIAAKLRGRVESILENVAGAHGKQVREILKGAGNEMRRKVS